MKNSCRNRKSVVTIIRSPRQFQFPSSAISSSLTLQSSRSWSTKKSNSQDNMSKFQLQCAITSLGQVLESWRITVLREIHKSRFEEGCKLLGETEHRQTAVKGDDYRLKNIFLQCKEIENLLDGALTALVEVGNLKEFRKHIDEKYPKFDDTRIAMRKEIFGRTPSLFTVKKVKDELVNLQRHEQDGFADLQDNIIQGALKHRLVKNWEKARVDQHGHLYSRQEKVICNVLEDYRRLLIREIDYSKHRDFMENQIAKLISELNNLQSLYANRQDEMDGRRQYLVSCISNKESQLQAYQDEYKSRAAQLNERKKSLAAIIIQNWWRNIMSKRSPERKRNSNKKKAKKRTPKKKPVSKKTKKN